jgi:hypothetical protein
MNYKSLLTKFIEHVRLHSGDTFVGPMYKDGSEFTKDEWKELRDIVKQLDA